MLEAWNGFKEGKWATPNAVDVRNFIQLNYTPYEGDDSFLAPATKATKKLFEEVLDLLKQEREAGGTLAFILTPPFYN